MAAVAAHRCDEVFSLANSVTLWRLPADIEERYDARWEHWLDNAGDWTAFFSEVAAVATPDLVEALRAFDLVSEASLARFARCRAGTRRSLAAAAGRLHRDTRGHRAAGARLQSRSRGRADRPIRQGRGSLTLTDRAAVVSSFTLIKGTLIDETYAVFARWDFAVRKSANLDRLREENYIGARAATWLRDVVFVLNRRFDPEGRDRALVLLAQGGCPLDEWRPLMLWHMTRDEFLVRDFLEGWLFEAYEQGAYRRAVRGPARLSARASVSVVDSRSMRGPRARSTMPRRRCSGPLWTSAC